LRPQPTQERLIGRPADKVAAATQHQSLIQRPLELVVALLHVAVLVGMRRLDRLAAQAVMSQQGLVTLRERCRTFRPRRDGRRQPVGAVQLRHTAQFPQGILQALAEALVALGKANRARLPVRVGQDEVVNQVIEGRAGNGHTQVGAMREVAGAQSSGMVDLSEEYLLGRSEKGTPAFDVPLQRPQLTIGKASRPAALQVVEQGLGLQSGVEPQLFFQLWPDLGEGIGPRAVVAFHASHLAGQFAEPAVLACRLVAHASLVGGSLLGQSSEIESSQSSHLLIGDHPEPPV
jgi:hypothetical protein